MKTQTWMSVLLFCACLTAGSLVLAAPPLLEKQDLFEGGKDGYALYRIPGMVVTPKGTVLALLRSATAPARAIGTRSTFTCGAAPMAAVRSVQHASLPMYLVRRPRILWRWRRKLGNPDDVTYNNRWRSSIARAAPCIFCSAWNTCAVSICAAMMMARLSARRSKSRPPSMISVLNTTGGHGCRSCSTASNSPAAAWSCRSGSPRVPAAEPSAQRHSVVYSDDAGRTGMR